MKFSQTFGICVVVFLTLSQYNFQPVEGVSSCVKNSTSCRDCVGLKDNCYWCKDTKKCWEFQEKKGKSQDNCGGSDMYYKQCFVSGNLLIIIIPSVVGGLLLILGCCIYCCCCRNCCGKKNKGIYDKEDKKLRKERSERKHLQDHRRAERLSRNEEIRMKYGLKPSSGEARYQRMEP